MADEEKEKIRAYREGAFQIDISDPDDPSGVQEFIVIADRMHVVKAHGVYRVDLPDVVDPGRTNAHLPPSLQRVLALGADDELVGRTLLLSKELCRPGHVAKRVNCDEAIRCAFDFLMEMAAARNVAALFIKDESELVSKFEGRANGGSLQLPAMRDVDTRSKKFVQSCSHAAAQLKEIVLNFYPELRTKEKWRDQLKKLVAGSADTDGHFKQFVVEANRFLTFLQNLRNAIEHPKVGQRVHIKDFALTAEGRVTRPSILLEHPKTPRSSELVACFMADTEETLLLTFELMLAHLCVSSLGI